MIITLEPIKPVPTFVYKCDSRFHTEVLKEMLEDDQKYGFIVIDGHGSLFATVQGNSQTILYRYNCSLPKKHRKGGQSSQRFQRLRSIARHSYLTKIAENATKYFIDTETNKLNVKGIVLAGSAEFKEHLSNEKFLDPRIQAGIITIVDVAYGFNQGLQQAIELSADCLKDVNLIHQRKLFSQFFDEIAQDTGKICFGPEETMSALESGIVETLLIWENLDIIRNVLVRKSDQSQKIIFSSKTKPIPQEDLEEYKVIESDSLIDYVAENYNKFGAQLQLVQNCSAEGNQFCLGFGGIGALLRYRMEENISKEEEKFNQIEDDDDNEEQYWI